MTIKPASTSRGVSGPQITDNQAKIIYYLHRERCLAIGELFTLGEEPQFTERDLAFAFVNLIGDGLIGVQVIDASNNAAYWLTPSALTAYDSWAAAGRVIHAHIIPQHYNHRCQVIPANNDSEAIAILRDVKTMIAMQRKYRRQRNATFLAELEDLLTKVLNH